MESMMRPIDCTCVSAAWWNAAPKSEILSDGVMVCESVERSRHEHPDWGRGRAHLLLVAAVEAAYEGASPLVGVSVQVILVEHKDGLWDN